MAQEPEGWWLCEARRVGVGVGGRACAGEAER